MKHHIKCSFLAALFASAAPAFAIEGSHCTIDPPNLLITAAAPSDIPIDQPTSDRSSGQRSNSVPAGPELVDLEHSAAVAHIKKSGAEVQDLGLSYGLRSLSASHGDQFMLFQLSPDGEAVVAGLASDISLKKLRSVPGAKITELGEAHGLAGYYLQNGPEFQVLYETPNHAAMISGVMWDMSGDTVKNITKDQVSKIEGTSPKLLIGNEQIDVAQDGKQSALALVEKTAYGTYGDPQAPRVWVFVDPLCIYSIRAMEQLQPYINQHRIEVAIIPIAVLDYEDQNRSTPAAMALLSKQPSEMVETWSKQQFDSPAAPAAEAHLHDNMAVAAVLGLTGTPMVVWRKADGSEGRIDGLPGDWNIVIGSLAGGALEAHR